MSGPGCDPFAPRRPATVVELVGVAGTGKTSLVRTMSRRSALIRAGVTVPRRSYLRDLASLLPLCIAMHCPWHGLLRKEMKRVLHLATLYRRVKEARHRQPGVILLDEGPVYMLARIRYLGDSRIESAAFERWWQWTIARWAEMLDVIVWLDADTPVLTDRIRSRPGPAPIHDTSDAGLYDFIGRYRSCYRRVVGELTAGGGPRLITLDTGGGSVDALAAHISAGISAEAA